MAINKQRLEKIKAPQHIAQELERGTMETVYLYVTDLFVLINIEGDQGDARKLQGHYGLQPGCWRISLYSRILIYSNDNPYTDFMLT